MIKCVSPANEWMMPACPIELSICRIAQWRSDILPGISAGRCSTFRHLTYITLNMSAHTHTLTHTPPRPAGVCVRMPSFVIAPDISRIEFGVNARVLCKPIIQSALS